MRMNAVKEVAGWRISTEHVSSFVRTFNAYPVAPAPMQYETSERRGQKYIDARYPARLIHASIRWQWDERKHAWWWSGSQEIELVNEQRYLERLVDAAHVADTGTTDSRPPKLHGGVVEQGDSLPFVCFGLLAPRCSYDAEHGFCGPPYAGEAGEVEVVGLFGVVFGDSFDGECVWFADELDCVELV